jgi:hypothetical protein
VWSLATCLLALLPSAIQRACEPNIPFVASIGSADSHR